MDDEAGEARVLYFCITLVQQVFASVPPKPRQRVGWTNLLDVSCRLRDRKSSGELLSEHLKGSWPACMRHPCHPRPDNMDGRLKRCSGVELDHVRTRA